MLARIGALSLTLCGSASATAQLSVERVVFESGAKAAQPSVTVDPREGFVITWQERDRDGSALRFAILDDEGKELRRGLVSSGSGRFVNGADFPSLAVLDNGDWVTFWLQKTASGTYAYEIRTVRSRDRGASWDASVVVHRDATPTEHGFVSMAPAGGDRVRMIWLDGRRMAASADGGEGSDEHMTLRSAVLGREGAPTEERELDSLTCACCQTDLVRTANATVAAYRDRTTMEIRDIGIVVFRDSSVSRPQRVHEDGWMMPGCPVNGPALAARGDRVLTVWPTMASGVMEVRAALGSGETFDAARILAEGDTELGRLDAVAQPAGWLVSRMTTEGAKPSVTLTSLADDGTLTGDRTIVAAAGGYPRMAVRGSITFVVFTEAVNAGESRVAVFRVTRGNDGREGEATK